MTKSTCPTCGQNYNAGAQTELALAQLLEARATIEKMEAVVEAARNVQGEADWLSHSAIYYRTQLQDALAKIEGRE